MADDARISTALPDHHKTKKLQRRCGESGCWSLVCLFLWVAANKPDGDLVGLSDEDIEIDARWTGAPGEFVSAIAAVGFLDGEEGARKIHDWDEHNPWAASRPKRQEAARNAAVAKWERIRNAKSCGSDAERTKIDAQRIEIDAERTKAQCPPPNPTQPNQTKKAPVEFNPTECARMLAEKHGLGGNEFIWILEDAIKFLIGKYSETAEQSRDRLDAIWEVAKIKYKYGAKKFFSESNIYDGQEWANTKPSRPLNPVEILERELRA